MKFRALLFGVGLIFSLMPTAALATTTPIAQKPYCTLYASSGVVELGRTTNLSWSSQYATQGFITSIGTVGINGVQGVIPTAPATTYVGTFTGPGGTGNCSVTVSIIQPSGSVGGGGGDTVPEPDKLPPANEITLDKTPGKGLISCGDTTGLTPGTAAYYAAATNCQACHLASLAQKIINFLLGLSIPLAAVMFAYAGVIYFSSGVEMSINKIEKAHAIFRSVGIGFMIVLGAWLGVQTVLKTILADEYYRGWNTIQCVKPESRPMNKDIGKDLLSVLPGLNTNTLAPASNSSQGTTPLCSYGSSYNATVEGCVNADGEVSQPTGYGPSFDEKFTGFGDCSVSSLGNTWGNNANAFSCIATGESSCNPALGSGTDKTSDNYAFSYGLYQVNMSAHNVQCSNYESGQTVNCTSAFSGKNYNAKVVDSDLYNKCKNMLQNVQCNTEMAQKIFQKQGFNAWKNTATKCGLL